jgi:hypothetical protein
MEVYSGTYPNPMTANPRIWGTDYKTFLFPIFAVYFEKQKRFCLYRVRVADTYHIIEPYKSQRTNPYFLNVCKSPAELPSEVYWAKAQFSFCIWFQGAWLCVKNGTNLVPVLPVMKITNFNSNCKYTKHFSVTIYHSPAAVEWIHQYEMIDKTSIRSATDHAMAIPYNPVSPKAAIPSIPTFIVNLLIEDAIAKKQDCSITMEPLTKETSAVTSCYHIFDRDAIAIWLATNKTCPVCKQECIV